MKKILIIGIIAAIVLFIMFKFDITFVDIIQFFSKELTGYNW